MEALRIVINIIFILVHSFPRRSSDLAGKDHEDPCSILHVTCSRTESERILIITKDDTLVCMAYKSVLLYVTIQSHANHANM